MSAAVLLALLAQFVRVGSDWDWLVAMGDHVRSTGRIPDHVPFAASDTAGWHNVPVLAELVASWVQDLGQRGAVVLHLLLVAGCLSVVATTARARGAGDGQVAVAIALLCLGGLATLGVVRAQTLSLLPFALMLALVTRQARRPDRGIWWAVPLVVVWANLHGAALLGVCVLGAYLVVGRLPHRPAETVAVGLASLLALCATPQLWSTPSYYVEVFGNVSAQRGEGLWARPSVSMPFDVLMVVAVIALLVVFARSPRRPLWEYVACIGLCVATASAARHGFWLLCLLAVLAAKQERQAGRAHGDHARARDEGRVVGAAMVAGVLATALALPVLLIRGDDVLGAAPSLVADVARAAGSDVVLAPSPLAEALAVEGVQLWAVNPLDALDHGVQAAYLDFLDGSAGGHRAIEAADVVVVPDGSPQAELVDGVPGFDARPCGAGWTCFLRR